ncbi:heme exporter protein CcmD [Nocardioides sp.]|uniref:heme exporter protein CcmD n=1 Tax=Nocardioides sp. TaxID=35761 RepID=UPI0039E65C2A
MLPFIVTLADPTPKDNDVVAGWTAFGIFLALVAAVAFLGWSLVRQLRKAQRAKEAGILPSKFDPR